uniref:Uncharacterized protein n=1 Tax=Equus asinus asinus TaxID=83772 RepID=A0A8C4M1D6_EQUAS
AHHYNQGGRADEEELQHPVADVGDGEGLVIADIGAAGLGRVTLEIRLLVVPHQLASRAQDEEAEDEKHCQPDLAHHSRVGVLVHTTHAGTLPWVWEPAPLHVHVWACGHMWVLLELGL